MTPAEPRPRPGQIPLPQRIAGRDLFRYLDRPDGEDRDVEDRAAHAGSPWIDAPVFDDEGRPVHARGVTASPGLYFVGLPWQQARGSALLGWSSTRRGASPTTSNAMARPRRRAAADFIVAR